MTIRSVSLGTSNPFISAANRMVATILRVWRARVARRQVMVLLEADDRMLADIGLTRSDVIGSLQVPLDTDPSHRLLRARAEGMSSRVRHKHSG